MTVSSRTAAPSKTLFRDLACKSCLNVLLDPFAQKYCLHCGDAVLVHQCTCGRPVPHKSDGSLYNHCSTCGAATDDLENKRPKIRLWAEEDIDVKCKCPCAGNTTCNTETNNITHPQAPYKEFDLKMSPVAAKKRKRAKIKSNKENESSGHSEEEPQETIMIYQPEPNRPEQGDATHVEMINDPGTSQIDMTVLGGVEDDPGKHLTPKQRAAIRGPRLTAASNDDLHAEESEPIVRKSSTKQTPQKQPKMIALIEVALVNLERRRRRLPPFDCSSMGAWVLITEHLGKFGYTASSIHAWRKKFYRLEQRYSKGGEGRGKFLYEDVFDAVLDRLETNYDFSQPDQYLFVTPNPAVELSMDCEVISGQVESMETKT